MSKGTGHSDQLAKNKLRAQFARAQFSAKLIVAFEALLPRLVWPFSILAFFVAIAWFGLFRAMPTWFRFSTSFLFIFSFVLSLIPLFRLRWINNDTAIRVIEERNDLVHQPLQVQIDRLDDKANPLAKALWNEHQERMAHRAANLKIGAPRPDITSADPYALRAIPALFVTIAFAFLSSNHSGSILDAFRFDLTGGNSADDLRIDAWITPPDYTSRAPIFLKTNDGTAPTIVEAPTGSVLTIRTIGDTQDITFLDPSGDNFDLPQNTAVSSEGTEESQHYETRLNRSGTLQVGASQWQLNITQDQMPSITFNERPKASVNGALEIKFSAQDDWGIVNAYAEIVPMEVEKDAISLFEPPQVPLTFSRRDPRDIKATSSKDLSEHPLAGKRVAITLFAEDGAGQKSRSLSLEIILPQKPFNDPLAGAIVEQRQIFSLDANSLQKAIDYNEAIGLRADETIPKLAHYLLLQSTKGRMEQARSTDDLYAAADYLWKVALEIEDSALSDAQRNLKDAQEKLAEALERGASSDEIAKLTEALRNAMNALMQELAQRGQQQMQNQQSQNNQNILRQRDLENMMKQIENLARSGDREAAQRLMNELQRMLNNLQVAQPRGSQQESGQQSQAQKQIEKLGELLQKQQQLMDETFKLDQQLRQREEMEQYGEDFSSNNNQAPSAEELKEALKKLREQQDALADDLKALQDELKGMGQTLPDGFGKAEREMRGAGQSLGKGQGERASEQQSSALDALREGAKQMMQQMVQNMQQGQGSGQPQAGTDPLGRQENNGISGNEYKIPDEMDVQRAREILNAIGEKLGRGQLNEVEKQYLERLLGNQ